MEQELPLFEVKPSQDFKGWLVVTCPREDCAEFFLVRRSAFLKDRTYITRAKKSVTISGRSCPYCFRAARIPARRSVRYT
jgi:hypothetical protein